MKGMLDDEVAGRESMRKRYMISGTNKPFNENLNPLYGWLRSIVGKKWDKCYSELCKKFDMRGVINAHILQHLYQDLETHTFVGDKGRVMFMDTRYTNKGEQPIKQCYKDYYVCPKDGTVKKTHKVPRRSVVMQKEAEKQARALEVTRWLNDTNVLHKIDGVWYHFELKPIPQAHVIYQKPLGTDTFKTGYQFLSTPNSRREKTWDELNQQERERFGVARVVGGTAFDLYTEETLYLDSQGNVRTTKWNSKRGLAFTKQTMYHATKKTASKKQLRQAGIS